MRRHVHGALDRVVPKEHSQDGELGTDDLTGGRRCADEAVVVGGVEGAEGLRLNGVEHLKALGRKQLLRVRGAQRRERQRLQVKELRVRRVLLRQDEVPEGDRQQRLRVDPSVGDDADEVLRGQRLSDGHGEVQGVLLLSPTLLQHEHLLVQDLLTIDVLHEDPEGLGAPVHLRVPLEVRRDGQLNHEAGPRDGLHVGTQIQLRELVDKLVDRLPHLRESDQLTDLGAGEVVVPLPGEVLLLHLPQDVLGETLEVAQRRLGAPHALVDHLAPVESPQRKGGPATAQADLKDGAHDPPCRLLHVHHVRK
mmetsp:Transcript_146031/g.364121  ORF Transcript_146031/g.364121 Transcript_146031/m.364121 type:complete len:308 (+) Transcript_146031:2311-3234(+)